MGIALVLRQGWKLNTDQQRQHSQNHQQFEEGKSRRVFLETRTPTLLLGMHHVRF
jgi:hypothetical protein